MRQALLALFLLPGLLCGQTLIEQLTEKAEAGDVQAQRDLAASYASGDGVEQDYAKAAIWYTKAAEQGHPDGQFFLGLANILGIGGVVPVNRDRGRVLLTQAASQGHEGASKALEQFFGDKPTPTTSPGRPAELDGDIPVTIRETCEDIEGKLSLNRLNYWGWASVVVGEVNGDSAEASKIMDRLDEIQDQLTVQWQRLGCVQILYPPGNSRP